MKVRSQPYLSLNGFIRYWASTSAAQRERVLRDFKYPDPEGEAQAIYYKPALDAIKSYHANGNDPTVLQRRLEVLEKQLPADSAQKTVKLEHNIRVIRAYRGQFGTRSFSPVDGEPVEFSEEGVAIRLAPDLVATERGRTRLIRFAFGKDGATEAERRVSTQMLRLYGEEAGFEIGGSDCQLLVVADGEVYQSTGSGPAFRAKLRSTLREVRRIWHDLS